MTDTTTTTIKRSRKMAREPKAEVLSAAELDNPPAVELPQSASSRPHTKSALVEDMLGQSEGASLAALCAATGWQPHTTRAFLTGLRKKGHIIVRSQRDGVSVWHMASGA